MTGGAGPSELLDPIYIERRLSKDQLVDTITGLRSIALHDDKPSFDAEEIATANHFLEGLKPNDMYYNADMLQNFLSQLEMILRKSNTLTKFTCLFSNRQKTEMTCKEVKQEVIITIFADYGSSGEIGTAYFLGANQSLNLSRNYMFIE